MDWMSGAQDDARQNTRRLRLRYSAACSICRCEMGRGTEAWWNSKDKRVTCLVCGSGGDMARKLAGVAGASGREKHKRMHERREEEIKGRLGKRVGGVVLAFTKEPQSTRAWLTGATGEERLAH